jgi:hypothetical protein
MFRRLCLLLAAIAPCVTLSVSAQEVVVSPSPEKVGVTIYRNPDRSPDDEMNLDWLEGYALITEQRTVEIPAGRAVLRFQGVAAGMLPESAIVTGLPAGVREKNLDADLLSPGSLYARSFGRPVILRREQGKSGKSTEERAVIRSGPDGSVIVQTRTGFEAANCGPLHDALIFENVPKGLSDKPTLSVETESAAPARVTLSLSYLAWGFDWQTNYVLRMDESGKRADMLAWVTLASSDATSFTDAETSVVGGKVNREDEAPDGARRGRGLEFHCFFRPIASVPQPAPVMSEWGNAGDIVVTARRIEQKLQSAPLAVTVREEGLGDLKLYRVPVPTTVAARAQKQVAMFDLPKVKLGEVYVSEIRGISSGEGAMRHLRLRNRKQDGLGRALPAGQVVVFQPLRGDPILSGEGILSDSAIGEDLDVRVGDATQVSVTVTEIGRGEDQRKGDWVEARVTVRNANPWPIAYEARIGASPDQRIEQVSGKLERKDGRSLWKVSVPENGSAQMRYRIRSIPGE